VDGSSGKSSAAYVDCDLAIGSATKTESMNIAANHRVKANQLPQSCAYTYRPNHPFRSAAAGRSHGPQSKTDEIKCEKADIRPYLTSKSFAYDGVSVQTFEPESPGISLLATRDRPVNDAPQEAN
jgi:hypothetical protein